MAAAPLPPPLEARFVAPSARLRWLHVVRGSGFVLVAGVLSAALIVLLDYLGNLSIFLRCFLQLAWLGAIGVLVWREVVLPWRMEIAPDSYQAAAAIRWVASGVALLLLALTVTALVSGSGERLRRIVLPWTRHGAASFRIVVSSGNPVVKRGEPLTLSAYLDRTEPSATLPEQIVLVFRVENDPGEYRLPMMGDGSGTYHITLPSLDVDLEYHVEASHATSEQFRVLVADPVELAPGSVAERVPPPYATTDSTAIFVDLHEIRGLQYSVATIRLKFNHPAFSAILEWRPHGMEQEPGTLVPLSLDPDRLGASAEYSLVQDGTLRLVLLNENGPRKLRSEIPIHVWVRLDEPPRFEQMTGLSPRPLLVSATERIVVSFQASDDLGVSSAELEYAVGPEFRPVHVPIPLSNLSKTLVEGRVPFDFSGKATDGQTIRLRLRVFDNRSLRSPNLGPQETVYPPAGWSEFTLSASAPPLIQQVIFGQRDSLRESLLASLKELREAGEELKAVREDGDENGALPLHHRIRITRARDASLKAVALLDDAARDAALTPELRPFASAVRLVAQTQLHAASEHLRKAATDNAAERSSELAAADADLSAARVKIEELLTRNARLAQDRYDRRRIEELNGDQQAIIERAKAGAPSAELAKDQQELLNRLRKVIAESDTLRRGSDFAAGREARQLAAETRDLATAVQELDVAARALATDTRKGLLARAGEAQAESAAAAAALLARIESAARLAGIAPPRPEDFRRISDLIAQDKLVEALIELEKLAADLDRLAIEFDRWAAERTDPKHAARQLGVWQDDLRTRVHAATKERAFAQLPDAIKTRFRTEQRTIRDAAARLKLPPDPHALEVRGATLLALNRAADELDGDGQHLDVVLKSAHVGLTRLAERTPLVRDRLAGARGELDKIRGEQDSLFTQAEAIARPALVRPLDPAALTELAKKLAPIQEKQQKLAERLAALDLPGFEPRQARAASALRAAASDLRDGLPFDSLVSLNWTKRELDRLKAALDNPPALDDRMEATALRQRSVAIDFDALGPTPTPKQLEPLIFTQRDIQRQLENLLIPEAPALLNDARETVKLAVLAFSDGSKPDEMLRRFTTAADALKRLADRMTAVESDGDRLKRLAANRTQTAEDAKKLVGKPRLPAASDEARRQLMREVDELNHTRVGPAGQVVKQRVLRLYGELQGQGEPDRQAGAQKTLADVLDELAAKAAETPALATSWPRDKEPAAPPPEDAFLPSRTLAEAIRDLARQQRTVRDRVNRVNADAVRLVKPAPSDPLGGLEQRQRVLADDLTELFRSTLATKDAATAEAANKALDSTTLAANALALGQVPSAKDHAAQAAARLRQLAATSDGKSWAKTISELSAKQDAIVADLNALNADSTFVAARLKAREVELTKKASELAQRFDTAAKELLPGDLNAQKLTDAAGHVRAARLQQAADLAGAAGGIKPGTSLPVAPSELATSDSLLEAEQAMKAAARDLAPNGDPAAALKSMQKAAAALQRAGKSIGDR